MSFDHNQFKQVYIEESLENIEIMEQELVAFDTNDINLDTVNTIFRAAHSIKGGAATFDFSEIAQFTHEVETLLDELRSGQREVTVEIIDCLLRSTDCIKMMVESYINDQDIDEKQIQNNLKEVKEILSQSTSESPTEKDEQVVEEEKDTPPKTSLTGKWLIEFYPKPHILFTGNEPLRLFRELEQYGQLEIEACLDDIPSFEELEPENCYINWQIILQADVDVDLDTIKEVFDWVLDDCKLIINPITSEGSDSAHEKIKRASDVSDFKDDDERRKAIPGNMNDQKSVKTITSVPSTSTSSDKIKPESALQTTQKAKLNQAEAADKKSINTVSIRVDIEKVDTLINLVGELVITQSMLSELGSNFDISKLESLQSGLGQLLQNTKELQESVMRIRMLPISNAFNRFPRMVRDLASQLNKKINLVVSGEQTELDKTVMEQITDPLVHLVRNSIDHGIESPKERLKQGKPESGTIKLNAYHEGGNIVIEISDDGAGLNRDRIHTIARARGVIDENIDLSDSEIYNLIFEPGFSTAEKITDVSGRGVGMDVVKRNISSLGGAIEIESKPAEGTIFRVRLPLTLAIVDGQLIRVGSETYVIPLVSIIESLQIKSSLVRKVSGSVELYRLRDENVPILRVYEEFGIETANKNLNNAMLVVVEGYGTKVGLLVDDLLAQQQVVIKSLETNYEKVEGISGATILGDGKVALIIDVADIIRKATRKRKRISQGQAA